MVSSVATHTVTELDRPSEAELLRFMENHEGTTLFHHPDWLRFVQEQYGHDYRQWIARSEEGIAGVFSVMAVRLPFLGTKLIASPYQYYTGMAIGESQEMQRELVQRAVDWGRKLGARYLEIRHFERIPFLEEIGFVEVDSQLVGAVTPLENLSLSQMRRGHSRYVRYAEESGLEINDASSMDEVRTFYRLFATEKRNMGTPQADWPYFERLHGASELGYRLLLARSGGEVIGGLLSLSDRWMTYGRFMGVGGRDAKERNAVKALYWASMRSAADDGCRFFNHGISWVRDEGLIRFKEGWNGITHPIHLYVYPIASQPPIPGDYFDGMNLAKAVWRRLPLSIAGPIGHQVTRWIC